MFKNDLRKQALATLEDAEKAYKSQATSIEGSSVKLFEVREKSSTDTLVTVESYINMLSNSPKEFDKAFEIFKAEIKDFKNEIEVLHKEYEKANFGKAGAGGALAGAGVAAFGPTAAMAVATTFGTASTGTAISALGGAAATNAALAWLGGGAIAAGGSGMAAGNALLALAGPVGWGIGAVSLAGAGFMARSKNQEIVDKAEKETRKVRQATSELRRINQKVQACTELTEKHSLGSLKLCSVLRNQAPNDYLQFNDGQKQQLAALINHINTLSTIIKDRF
ncbi:hypothetical protein FCV82_02205 [Vibrio breoganii]|uniref:hypothetical protein n=1 Tax=Vibrio breoganii TaxID=553239 RepID=UPI000C82C34E|nr:hypothetical protein [Vibrio breoganii]PMN67109.1 hypothetical protein BCT28_03910 [Vibrio breoganii]PMO82914.1 hypothetical protein BCT00_06690 [Vibrio breoganii]TKF90405.1 hypothetical protein FCV82_02205 [Vibrio breoganii]